MATYTIPRLSTTMFLPDGKRMNEKIFEFYRLRIFCFTFVKNIQLPGCTDIQLRLNKIDKQGNTLKNHYKKYHG